LLLVREHSKKHDGRLIISYAPYIKYNGIENQSCIDLMQKELGCTPEGCWFVYDISIKNQSELYFSAVVVNASAPMVYSNSVKSKNRSEEWKALIPADGVLSESLQQIFYGAPGTGKSNTIKKETEEAEKEGRVFRTTFHPDSDYSTFVGCYKPSMKSSERIYSLEELTAKLKEIKTSGTTYPCHKFGAKYWKSLKDLSAI
jgi:Cdc6-like AAA superfamily ATPase